MRRTSPRVVAVLAALVGAARADAVDDAVSKVGTLAKHTIDRTRRDVAAGPTAGGYVGVALDGGAVTDGVSFGLAVYIWEGPQSLGELVAARTKARLGERLKAIVASGGTPPTDLSELVREIAADVIAELQGRSLHKNLLDKPRFGVVIEGVKLTSPGGGGQFRVGISKGVGHLSAGAMLGVQRAGGETLALGGLEVSVRLTPWGTTWTPVIEPFVRVDAGLESSFPIVVGGGARVVLDLF